MGLERRWYGMERNLHGNEHVEQCIFAQIGDQNTGNHDEMCYSRGKHTAWIGSPFYVCCMDEDVGNNDNQKPVKRSNRGCV